MNKFLFLIFVSAATCSIVFGQHVALARAQVITLTSEWKGERFDDGRPKVSDEMLERLKNVSIEEAWGILRNKGYQNQFEGNELLLILLVGFILNIYALSLCRMLILMKLNQKKLFPDILQDLSIRI